jgi:heptaprenyl diphosphate synthase
MTDFWNNDPKMAAALKGVAAVMDQTVRNPSFPLGEEVSSLVASNGKMLRPALLIIGAGFGTKASEAGIRALAAAVELLHVSTLIHDDVIDEAELRRGVPTLHTRLGTKEAILAGDWLFSRCFLLAAESTDASNAQTLARVIAAICSSEIRQDLGKWSYSTSLRSYHRIIAGKTAALFGLSLVAGAIEAKAPRRQIETLRRAGYDLGMAFQIIDDILDFESTEGVMRKPVGRDIAEGLCTLPLIHALRADEKGMKALLAGLRPGGPDSPVDESAVKAVLARSIALGGVEAAKIEASRITTRAKEAIATLPPCEAKARLEGLTESLLSRSY